MSLSSRTIVLIVILCPVAVVMAAFIASRFEDRNGERRIYGHPGLAERTVATEEFCSKVDLPEGSVRLNTHVISKRASGLVTSTYVTDLACYQLDRYFQIYAARQGWHLERTTSKPFLGWTDTRSEFSFDGMSIEVDCTQTKSYRGERHYAVSCGWQKD